LRIVGIVAVAWIAGTAACRGTEKKEKAGAAPGAVAQAADFFSCVSETDCVVENQKDCCPCNAGGRQIALRKKSLDAFRAARTARCGGDLLCPQVYLCDDTATAVCLAGKCALGHGGGAAPAR